MPIRRITVKERFVLAFLYLVVISLLLSISFSYALFITNLNKRLDPQILESSNTIEDRITELKERNLIYADIITKEDAVVEYLGGSGTRDDLIERLRRVNSKIGLDIIQVIDVNGKVRLRLENLSKFNDLKTADKLVRSALLNDKTTTFFIEDDKLTVLAGVPVQDQGRITGVVLAGYVVNNQLLARAEGSLDKQLSIFGLNGNLIATTIANDKGVSISEQKLEPDLISQLKTKGDGIKTVMNINSGKYRAFITPVSRFDGELVGFRMTALSLTPIIKENAVTILSLIISNIFAIVVAYFIAVRSAKKLVDPILAIKKGTEIIGAGNLSYKIKVNTNDEVEELATSFNNMADRLSKLVNEVGEEKNKISAERNKFSIVLEGVLDGIFTLDYERRITLFNKAAQEITGLSEEEVIGRKCDEVLLIFRNKSRMAASDFCPLTPFNKDQIVFSDKNLKLVTSRRELYITMTSAVIKESKIADLGCIVTFRDSSKERELEEMKLDFVSMAAHELRTPLTTIRGYVSLLEGKIKDKITEEEVKFLERVSIASSQLASLVENLLDVSKIEHNTLELDIKPENWVDILQAAVESFEELSRQKKIKLILNAPQTKLPAVAVDKFRISEVISNLIANAINYTDENGKIEVTAVEENGMVKTTVSDTGAGIPARSIPHLFTKFYRVSGVLEQGSKGTGLGLFISKSIVNMHKGDIWVESELGVGSKLFFTLPIYIKDESSPKSLAS